MSDALSPTAFLRVSFDKSVNTGRVEDEVQALLSDFGVVFDSMTVKDGSDSAGLVASQTLKVEDVESVSGDVVDFEVAIAELDGFEEFDTRLSESSKFDADGERVRKALGISKSEGQSLGL